jgi:hypothetical protein
MFCGGFLMQRPESRQRGPPSVGEALSAQFTDPRLGGVDGAWGVLARSAREESGPSEEEEEEEEEEESKD